MNLITFKRNANNPVDRILNDFFKDDFFRTNVHEPALNGANFLKPAVNIAESEDKFRIDVIAPGMQKKDFKIDYENDLLTVSREVEEQEEKDWKYTKKEYGLGHFKRAFTVPENINVEQITATYKNGILSIYLPKLEEEKAKKAKVIKVA